MLQRVSITAFGSLQAFTISDCLCSTMKKMSQHKGSLIRVEALLGLRVGLIELRSLASTFYHRKETAGLVHQITADR